MTISNEEEKKKSEMIFWGNRDKKQIALTFDTGKIAGETLMILKVLKEENVKCTFFVTGCWAKQCPELLKQMVSEGHEIGNHSFDHPDMTEIPVDESIKNIIQGRKAIEEIAGVSPELFRLPYGNFNDQALQAAYEAGYDQNIMWSIDTLDWRLPPMQSILNRILHKAKNGAIVLMHVGGNHTAEATKRAIVNLKARNYSLVTVGEIIKE